MMQWNFGSRTITVYESSLKIFLGVVVLIGAFILSLSYFQNKTFLKNSQELTAAKTVTTETPTYKKELIDGTNSVALPVVHIVKPGETLWSISENYYSSGFNWHDISNANPTVKPESLEVGTKLTIPKAEIAAITTGTIKPVVVDAKITGDSYLVVHGDDLWDVALRAYGDPYRWTEISRANNLLEPGVIHPGNILKIPRS